VSFLFKVLLAAALTLVSGRTEAQETAGVAPATLTQINHLPWPRIGSPPAEGGRPADASQWRQEAAAFGHAFEAIRGSWTGEEVMSIADLRGRVRQYEDLIATVTGSPGYGNALLADCLRRLSLTLMVEYALGHPAENDAIGELLRTDRVRLLDCDTVQGMLSEELKIDRPPGGWRIVESRQQFDSLFQGGGTTYGKEMRRVFWAVPGTSALINKRDVYALLIRIVETETLERVELSGLIEFRRLGGRLEDLDGNDVRPFLRVMEHDRRRFQFLPAGINMLRQEHLGQLRDEFDPQGKKVNGFTKRALE